MTTPTTKPLGPRALRSSLVLLFALSACATAVEKGAKQGDLDKMRAIASKVSGTVVWTSNREGLPHIFSMKLDGSSLLQLTEGDHTDWFPRLSPDGTKVLFTRSHARGLVRTRDANLPGAWDLYTVNADGSDLKKVVGDGAWGSWVSGDEILFVRGGTVLRQKLDGSAEAVVLDAGDAEGTLGGAALQQPQLSPDGKYLALTLGGGRRQVGVWKVKKKLWNEAGVGGQAAWMPDGTGLVWSDLTGKELSSIARVPVEKGVPAKVGAKAGDGPSATLLDMPGRRSREDFPRPSGDGKWLVYAAAIHGAESDVEDYELFIWEVGTAPDTAVRLTFNTGPDTWPDLFTGAPSTKPSTAAEGQGDTEGESPAEEGAEKAAKSEQSEKAPADEASAAPAEAEAAAEETPAAAEESAAPVKAKGKGKKPAPKAKKKR
jgi:hypothetical protein